MDDIVRPGQTIAAHKHELRTGGKGANQAVAIAKAGGKVLLAGNVGTHEGKEALDEISECGVDVKFVQCGFTDGETNAPKRKDVHMGRAIIQIAPTGENSIGRIAFLIYLLIPIN